ncbi:hypothetical protein ATANTOWER_020553, partial [Ataeniobius toweri]|nr:hypothetical protein [Ataeniobius toweri]
VNTLLVLLVGTRNWRETDPMVHREESVNECVRGSLPCVCLCCPAVDWQPVQGVPRLSPIDCWK